MRKLPLIWIAAVAVASSFVAVGQGCGDSGSSGGGGPGGAGGSAGSTNTNPSTGGSPTTSTTPGGGGTTSTTTENTGGSGGGTGGSGGGIHDVCSDPAGTKINGCAADGSDAVDKRGSGEVTIKFGGVDPGEAYAPRCIIVSPNQKVTYVGSFNFHPLTPGEIRKDGLVGTACPDTSGDNPIKDTSATDTTKTFMIPDAGKYPYFCAVHGPGADMDGLVIVKN